MEYFERSIGATCDPDVQAITALSELSDLLINRRIAPRKKYDIDTLSRWTNSDPSAIRDALVIASKLGIGGIYNRGREGTLYRSIRFIELLKKTAKIDHIASA